MNPIKNHRGFTLVEIIFAMATGVIVMAAIYMAVMTAQRSSVRIEQRISATQDVRASLEVMSMEIGMASFNPLFVPALSIPPFWRDQNCSGTSADPANRGIRGATPNAITVEMDIDENGALDGPNEVIAYAYDAANRQITRATNCGAAQSILGQAAGTPQRIVRVINGDLNIPVFRYFDGLGVEIPAANLPGAIPNIRRIEIALAVETEYIDPATQQPQRVVYSNGVILRNHAFSL